MTGQSICFITVVYTTVQRLKFGKWPSNLLISSHTTHWPNITYLRTLLRAGNELSYAYCKYGKPIASSKYSLATKQRILISASTGRALWKQHIPYKSHTGFVSALVWLYQRCVVWCMNPYSSGLLHWYWDNHMTDSTYHGDVIMGTIASQITSRMIVYSTVYSDADQRKHQSAASLAFVRRIYRGPVNWIVCII